MIKGFNNMDWKEITNKSLKVTGNERQKRLTIPNSYNIPIGSEVVVLLLEDLKDINLDGMEEKDQEINKLLEKVETLEAANLELIKTMEDKDKYINQLEKDNKNLEHYKANDVNLGFLAGRIEALVNERNGLINTSRLIASNLIKNMEKEFNDQVESQGFLDRIRGRDIEINTAAYDDQLNKELDKAKETFINIDLMEIKQLSQEPRNVIDVETKKD